MARCFRTRLHRELEEQLVELRKYSHELHTMAVIRNTPEAFATETEELSSSEDEMAAGLSLEQYLPDDSTRELLDLLEGDSLRNNFHPQPEELRDFCNNAASATEATKKEMITKKKNLINDLLVSYVQNWYVVKCLCNGYYISHN